MRSTIFAGLCLLLIFLSLPGCLSPENNHVKNGDYYLEQGDWTLAISEYEKALAINAEIDINNKLAESYLNRAIDFTCREQWALAIEDIEKARGLSPDIILPEVLINDYIGIADDFAMEGDWGESQKYYKVALEIDPTCVYALNNMGCILSRQGLYKEALTYLDEAITLDNANKNAHFNRCEVLKGLDCLSSAVLDAEKLIELYPDIREGYYYRGYINWLKDDFEAIIPDMDIAIAMDPLDANALNMRGAAYSWYCDWPKAKEDYDKAILLNPSFRLALYNRAAVYYNTRQCDLAIEDATKVIDLRPDPDVMDDLSLKANYIISYCILE